MALRIEDKDGLFEISGRVTSQNLGILRTYFQAILEKTEHLLVSIEKVTEMDSSAAHFFERFYREVASDNKIIHIIGRHNPHISKIMHATKTDYILSTDRV
jgi:anti-anti-sigma regulatory factor